MATPEYNPTEAFNDELKAQQAEAIKMFEATLDARMAFSIREQHSRQGSAAESRLTGVLNAKTDQVNTEIQKIIDSQLGELDENEKTIMLGVQKAVFDSIQGRVMMGLEMATTGKEDMPSVSTNIELAHLQKIMGWIEKMDIQYMVFQSLGTVTGGEALQENYLESVGRKFNPDFFGILTKNSEGKDLEEKDWVLLVTEVGNLGNNPDTMKQSEVMMVLGTLSESNRTELVRRLAKEEDFPNFGAVLTSMVGSGYLTALAATVVLDEKIAELEKQPKKFKEEIGQLKAVRDRINSQGMRQTQVQVSEQRVKTAEYFSHRSYGHKNRARELLTLKGVGSALLTVNGALTVFANVAMGITEPTDIPLNPALWIGVAQVGAGLHFSKGFSGLVLTPTEMAAAIGKNDNEETDDKMEEYKKAFQTELNNYHREAHFYAHYAERIVTVYKAKKAKNPDQPAPITLRDIGVEKKEDLPQQLQDVWDRREGLQLKISDWAAQFSRINSDDAMRETEWQGQRTFIETARKEVDPKIKDLNYEPPLPPFDYKAE